MHTFASELLFVLAVLVGLGLAGGFVVLPFRSRLPFAVLAAPFAGLLCVVLGAAALYSLTDLKFVFCAAGSAALCFVTTGISCMAARPRLGAGRLGWVIVAVALVAPVVTWMNDAATIQLGHPALLYTDGTDHLGYAQLADWLVGHRVSSPPVASADSAYEDFPARLFRQDPRFGSFFTLAIVEQLRGLSGAFSYDIGCTIVLAAGILGVAGVFARSGSSLLLLLMGLLTCHWYEYSRGGYFGKLLAYPAALLVTGLFFALPDSRSPVRVGLLAAVASAAALMHSGVATALFIFVVVAPHLVSLYLQQRRSGDIESLHETGRQAAVAALLIGIAVVATGVLARPVETSFPDWNLNWSYIFPRIIDLEGQGVSVTGLTATGLQVLAVSGFFLWILLIGAALFVRDPVAIGLLAGPFLLVVVMAILGARAAVFQLIGFPYPLMLCGAARLFDTLGKCPLTDRPRRSRAWQAGVLVLAIIALGMRVPRLEGSIQRYAGRDVAPMQRFSKPQIDRLVAAIDRQPVDVDIVSPTQAIFVLVEFGRRGVPVQWTPRAWQTVVGYTHFPPPKHPAPGRFKLVLSTDPDSGLPVVDQTVQYKLLDQGSGFRNHHTAP